MRTSSYVAGSVLAAVIVVWHAFASREQFFPSMVHLSNSKLSAAILANLGFASALSIYKSLVFLFLGRLRDIEVERINDKVSQAIIETLLALTIFRQEFTITFFTMFVVLSFIKICHWLVQDRVDFIETTPNVTRSQHLRMVSFLLVLTTLDYFMLSYELEETFVKGVSVHLLFAFEYSIQATTAVATLIKYGLSMTDMALEGRWESKGVAVFYLELALDLLHLITYSAFFAIVFSTYGIPIHLVRDLYWTFRNFQQRVRDFLRYRRVAKNMERRFPDATDEDLQRADHTCIVCREEMASGSRAKRLDCSHCFHVHCLRSWLERQQNCPICRAPVLAQRRPTEPERPAAAVDNAQGDVAAQQHEVQNQQAQQQIDHNNRLAEPQAQATIQNAHAIHPEPTRGPSQQQNTSTATHDTPPSSTPPNMHYQPYPYPYGCYQYPQTPQRDQEQQEPQQYAAPWHMPTAMMPMYMVSPLPMPGSGQEEQESTATAIAAAAAAAASAAARYGVPLMVPYMAMPGMVGVSQEQHEMAMRIAQRAVDAAAGEEGGLRRRIGRREEGVGDS